MKTNITQCLKALTILLLFGNFTTNAQTVSHDFKNTINDVFEEVELNRT